MDETIRVKIVADTTQINSSLKQVNKETQSIAQGGTSANAAMNELNRTLNSLGFRAVRLKAVGEILTAPKTRISADLKSIRDAFTKLKSDLSGLDFKKDFLKWDKNFNI